MRNSSARSCWPWLKTAAYTASVIHAEVGNIVIRADRHGMGYTCTIDGEPVKRLRNLTLRLELDKLNTVTLEILANHQKESQK